MRKDDSVATFEKLFREYDEFDKESKKRLKDADSSDLLPLYEEIKSERIRLTESLIDAYGDAKDEILERISSVDHEFASKVYQEMANAEKVSLQSSIEYGKYMSDMLSKLLLIWKDSEKGF